MTDPSIVKTKYWHILNDGRVQCDLCPRECKLHEGQQGLCFVRANQNNEIVLTTYGRSSGFCIDPIEKKPLNHFFPVRPFSHLAPQAVTLLVSFVKTGISANHEKWTRWPMLQALK